MDNIALFWFRRDLRLHDNAGLYHALRSGLPVLPLFIFDSNILNKLEDKKDARVTFIHQALGGLKKQLADLGSDLLTENGEPEEAWRRILEKYPAAKVFTNHDYEPYALERDQKIKKLLEEKGIGFHTFKDHVIFEKDEVVKDNGEPYVVFTPYSRAWKARLTSFFLKAYPVEKYFTGLLPIENELPFPSLHSLGFEKNAISFPATEVPVSRISNYEKTRDFPAIEGTSRLGIHYRFGTVSIREKAARSIKISEKYLNELIWRDFYQAILWHFPQVVNGAFKPAYDHITWRNDEAEFLAWCEGKTGYPIVDAGLRELNATGYMHNRVRMIVASFLTKHLLIDWRWGEAYFAKKLLDFDLASNNGGWQWAAGCGVDAAPYFRVFNPELQTLKFDKQLVYIKKWVPEFGTSGYPAPIVDHKMARERCLLVYKAGLSNTF